MGQTLQRAVPPSLLPALAPPLPRPPSELDPDEVTCQPVVVSEPQFSDLNRLPPELALTVLANLNATDLCLASCVWQQLASDNILWQGLCRAQWSYASIYDSPGQVRYRQVYLWLDEGTLTFNADASQGMNYFIQRGLVTDNALEIARFIHGTSCLRRSRVRQFTQSRQDVVSHLVSLQNFANTFLPNALRSFFSKLEAPNERGTYLQKLLEQFSVRFCQCNPALGISPDSVYVLCFSLILLSVDLASPHVKNKMSKREFIRNTRGAVESGQAGRALPADDDLFGNLYDNVFVRGHIAEKEAVAGERSAIKPVQEYVPGYLAIFL